MMDELYEYMKERIEWMISRDDTVVAIDTSHAFRLYQMVCFMKQIRGIINNENDMWYTLRKIKEERV